MEFFTPNGPQMEIWSSIERPNRNQRGDKIEYLTVEGTKWNITHIYIYIYHHVKRGVREPPRTPPSISIDIYGWSWNEQ
jgi:hypothetical protein